MWCVVVLYLQYMIKMDFSNKFTVSSLLIEGGESESCEDFLSVPDQAQGLQSRLMTQATRPRRLMAPPDHPHDTRQRPVTKSRPESGRDGAPASTRGTPALILASDPCYVAHTAMRIYARTPR